MLDHLDVRKGQRGDGARHVAPDGVVAPVWAAQSHDEDGFPGHVRSTVRSRKWVAHEMQGS